MGLASLLGGLLAAAQAWSAEPAPGPREAWRVAPVGEAELRALVAEVAPLVEEVAGRRFRALPEVVIADPEAVARALFQEQVHLLSRSGRLSEAEARAQAGRAAVAAAPALAGKYGLLDQRLYVSLEGVEEALALEGRSPDLQLPLLRVLLAHELTHALQDQVVDLDATVGAAASADGVMALNCLVEGHAVWVHERVGARLGLPEAVALMADLLGLDRSLGPGLDPSAFQSLYVYGLGREFVAYQADHGGVEQVWRVLGSPPSATSGIVAPWTWERAAPTAVSPSQRRVLSRASARLAGPGWRAEESPMGDYDVRDQLVRAGADHRIADALDAGWNARRDGGSMAGVELQVLRFGSELAARAFVEGMLDRAEDQARRVGSDPFFAADARAFQAGWADLAGREVVTVSLLGPELADHLGRIWAANGRDVVQVVLVNAPATDRRIRSSLSRVFRALDAD